MKNQFKIVSASLLFVAFLFVSSISANAQETTMETGSFSVDQSTQGNRLSNGTIGGKPAGERKIIYEVKFSKSFPSTPKVNISVTGMDAATAKGNLRYKVGTKYLSREGFVIEITTWHDTEILSMEGSWLAISN